MTPPPIPRAVGEKSWAHHAALGSLAAPLLVLVMLFMFGAISKANHNSAQNPNLTGQTAVAVAAIKDGAALLVLLAGLVAGVAALCAIPRHGTAGILGRSIAGLVINGLFLAIFATNFIVARGKAMERRQARLDTAQNIHEVAEDFQAQLKSSYDPETGITNMGSEQLGRYNKKIETASRTLTGEDAVVMKVMADYLQRAQACMKKFEAAVDEYRTAEVLNASTLKSQAQIEPRRKIVRKVLTANEELRQFVVTSDATVRADLQKARVSEANVNGVMLGFQKKAATRNKLNVQIRDCDRRAFEANLGILDLFDSQWGHWNYNAKTDKLTFETDEALDSYNGFLETINTAAEEEVAIQGKLVKTQ